jgi:hypothetical protein
VQQLREAFAEAGRYRYAIFDRDSKFDAQVVTLLKTTGLEPKPISAQAPWQNGVAERWIRSCRREMLDQVIPLHEPHLRRLIRDSVTYAHGDRMHDSLEKDRPNRRDRDEAVSDCESNLQPASGWPHHRYTWREAALQRP